MPRSRFCLDCGASPDETYISTRLLCIKCARKRAVANVDLVYEQAAKLGPRPDETLRSGIERATGQVVAVWSAANEVRAKRADQRRRVKARLIKAGKLVDKRSAKVT